MRHLQALNIDRLLDEQLSAYLTHQDAQALRQHCLSITPIQPIMNTISTQLKTAAEQDKTEEATRLRDAAYQSQLTDDQTEASKDRALTARYSSRKGELQHSLRSIETENRKTEIEALDMSRHLSLLRSQLNDIHHQMGALQPQHTTTHHHPGHATAQVIVQNTATNVHVHPDAPINPQERRLIELNRDKDKLLRAIDKLNQDTATLKCTVISRGSSLQLLKSEINDISGQEIQLRQREIARAERSRSPRFSIEALTQANREKLNRDTRTRQNEIDAHRVEMENISIKKCHPAFLNTLERDLRGNTLPLQNFENATLLSIIAKMRCHIADLVTLDESRHVLRQSQLNLNNQLAMQTAAESSTTRLDIANRRMKEENIGLLEANVNLSHISNDRLNTRNQFAQYALVATVLTAIGATVGYLLNATLLMMVAPVVPIILASLAGVVIAGLLITSAIAWISAAITQSEIDANHASHNNNLVQIADNSQEMTRLSKSQLPAIEAAIQRYQQESHSGQRRVEQAEANARGSFAAAEGIAVNLPFVTQSGFGMFPPADAIPQNNNQFVSSYQG